MTHHQAMASKLFTPKKIINLKYYQVNLMKPGTRPPPSTLSTSLPKSPDLDHNQKI
jgi:hypothetical protein